MFLRDPRSQSTVRVLCNVAAGCSLGGLALLAEERRRRIAFAQRIIENGRLLQQYKAYHGVAPISAFEPLSHGDTDRVDPKTEIEKDSDHGVVTRHEWVSKGRKSRRLPTGEELQDVSVVQKDALAAETKGTKRSRPSSDRKRSLAKILPKSQFMRNEMSPDSWSLHMQTSDSRQSRSSTAPAAEEQIHQNERSSQEVVAVDAHDAKLFDFEAATKSIETSDALGQRDLQYHLDRFLPEDAREAMKEKQPLDLKSVGTAIQRAVGSRARACMETNDERQWRTGMAELKAYFRTFTDLPVEPIMMTALQLSRERSTNYRSLEGILQRLDTIKAKRDGEAATNSAPGSLGISPSIEMQLQGFLEANRPGLAYKHLVSQWPAITQNLNEQLHGVFQKLIERLIEVFSKLGCFAIVKDLQARYVGLCDSIDLLVKDAQMIVEQLSSGDVVDLCTFAVKALGRESRSEDAMKLILVYCRQFVDGADWRDACRLLSRNGFSRPSPILWHMAKSLQQRCQNAKEADILRLISGWLSFCTTPNSRDILPQVSDFLANRDPQSARDLVFFSGAPLIEIVKALSSDQMATIFQTSLANGEYEEATSILQACSDAGIKPSESSFAGMVLDLAIALPNHDRDRSSAQVEAATRLRHLLLSLAPSLELVADLTVKDELSAKPRSLRKRPAESTPEEMSVMFDMENMMALYRDHHYAEIIRQTERLSQNSSVPADFAVKLYHAYTIAGNALQLQHGVHLFAGIAQEKDKAEYAGFLVTCHIRVLFRSWQLTESLPFVHETWKMMQWLGKDAARHPRVLDGMMSIALQSGNAKSARFFMQLRVNTSQPAPSAATYSHIALMHAQAGDWEKVNELLATCGSLQPKSSGGDEYSSLNVLVREACMQLPADAAVDFVAQLADQHGIHLSDVMRNHLLNRLVKQEDAPLLESWFLWLASRGYDDLQGSAPALTAMLHRIERPYEHIYNMQLGARNAQPRLEGQEMAAQYRAFRQKVAEASDEGPWPRTRDAFDFGDDTAFGRDVEGAFEAIGQSALEFHDEGALQFDDQSAAEIEDPSAFELQDHPAVDLCDSNQVDFDDRHHALEVDDRDAIEFDPWSADSNAHFDDMVVSQDVDTKGSNGISRANRQVRQAHHNSDRSQARQTHHDGSRQVRQASDYIQEIVAADESSAETPGKTILRGRRKVERRMLLQLASRDSAKAVRFYHESSAKGLYFHSVDLAIAVASSIKATGSTHEARRMIAEAQSRGLHVARALKALRLHQSRQIDDLTEDEAVQLAMEAYRSDRHGNLPTDHYVTLALARNLRDSNRARGALRLLAAARRSPDAPAQNLLMLSMQMQIHIISRRHASIARASAQICSGAFRIDKHYLGALRYRRWWHRRAYLRALEDGNEALAEHFGGLVVLIEACAEDAKRVYERQHNHSLRFAERFVELVERIFPKFASGRGEEEGEGGVCVRSSVESRG